MSIVDFLTVVRSVLIFFGLGYSLGKDNERYAGNYEKQTKTDIGRNRIGQNGI
jgi:hypothetical protein